MFNIAGGFAGNNILYAGVVRSNLDVCASNNYTNAIPGISIRKKESMDTLTLDVQKMYGDHHVLEVRRILLELPGVEDVYASSSFHVVEVTYDPGKINSEQIKTVLEEAGYLGELPMPAETGEAAYGRGNGNSYFRHTMVYENTRQVVSFAQNVDYSGRPLWPCPGMGLIKSNKPEEE